MRLLCGTTWSGHSWHMVYRHVPNLGSEGCSLHHRLHERRAQGRAMRQEAKMRVNDDMFSRECRNVREEECCTTWLWQSRTGPSQLERTKEGVTRESIQQQTEHDSQVEYYVESWEAYGAFTIIDSIRMDDGVQKGTLKKSELYFAPKRYGRERNVPQYEDLGGHLKSWLSKSESEETWVQAVVTEGARYVLPVEHL